MEYYVAPNGNNANPGTITQPWVTWHYAFNRLSAGDTLFVRGGLYSPEGTLSNSKYCAVAVDGEIGSIENKYKVLNYQNEIPVLDCTDVIDNGNRVGILLIDSAYWEIKGLEIKNCAQYANGYRSDGLFIIDSNNNLFERIVSHHNGGPGIELRYASEGNTFLNCDAYSNFDPYTDDPGDDADGFDLGDITARAGNERINHLIGCRAWNNGDDGFDLYQHAGSNGITYMKNCWAWHNGYFPDGVTAAINGHGFKLGDVIDDYDGVVRRFMYNCIAYDNRLIGIAQENANVLKRIYNCVAYANGTHGFSFYQMDIADIIRNNLSFYNIGQAIEDEGSVRISDHNSWNGINFSAVDFISLDGSQLVNARQNDGNLPIITFLHLTATSVLRAKGISVGLETDGEGKLYLSPPSIGAFEYGSAIPNVVLVTDIVVSGAGSATTITVDKGTLQMSAAVTPSGATNKNVVWSKTNGTGKATISYTGLLTAQTDGTVTVRATAVDGSGIYGELEITISNQVAPTLVTSIVLSTTGDIDAITIDKGSIQINKTVSPGGANQVVIWTVSNNAFANISESGILTAITNGIVTVRATATDGSDIYGEIVITISNQVVQGIALLAPEGWHIPSDTEWQEHIDYLGGTTLAGGKLKETGLVNWDTPNTGADNISGFTALGAGYRLANGTFGALKEGNCTWSATEVDSANAHRLNLAFDVRTATIVDADKKCGCTVRCIKDDSVDPGTMKDIDGNIYPTVKIGNQVWMGEDLRVTRLRDGSPIPLVTGNTEWANLTGQGYCWYNNTP
jgi:uncharacterized protein (TIGR02145 family)